MGRGRGSNLRNPDDLGPSPKLLREKGKIRSSEIPKIDGILDFSADTYRGYAALNTAPPATDPKT